MKFRRLLIIPVSIMLVSCSAMPYKDEEKIELGIALRDAIQGVNYAHQYAKDHNLSTYKMRPAEATISLDLTTKRGDNNELKLAAALPHGASAGFGWGANRSVEKGSHLVIKFTPKE